MSEVSDESTEKTSHVRADIFAGAGLGLLLGTVMGLAVTPVVATVVGALASMMAILLGLDQTSESSRIPAVNGIRIGSFGLATVLGLLIGLFIRINNPLAEPPTASIARWNEAFPDNPVLARQMMVFERTGGRISPQSLAFSDDAAEPEAAVAVDTTVGAGKSAVLFSALSEFDACSRLDPGRFASPRDVLGTYGRRSSPEIVKALGSEIAELPEAEQATAVRMVHSTLCAVQQESLE